MAKEIDVSKAAEWSDEEAEFNLMYLRQRARYQEADQIEAARGGPKQTESTEAPPPDDPNRGVVEQEEVPDGTVSEVLDWVGEDKDRAARTLQVELEKDSPRKTLVDELNALIDE